jgi:hypothetical protein
MRYVPWFPASILLLLAAVDARADEWERLGSRVVTFTAERDTIPCAGDGLMNALRIDVDDGTIEMYDMRIHFRTGEVHSPATRLVFRPGERSRIIDLPGAARAIAKIEFVYRSRLPRGRATVTIFGRRAAAAPAVPVPVPPPAAVPVAPVPPPVPVPVAPLPVAPVPADDGRGWELLGVRIVNYRAEKDVFEITGREGRFRSLRMEVDEGAVEVFNVRVVFGDGSSFSPETRLLFGEGSRSRTLDFPGEARVIRQVEMWFKTISGPDRGRVRLYGLAAAPAPVVAERWEKLGSRVLDFAVERDVIDVGAVEGRFNAIRLDVEGGNIDLFDLRVEFSNGAPFSPATRFEFRQGSLSRVIDLPGEARSIRRVAFLYRSELRLGRATVHLFGRHAPAAVAPVPPPARPLPGLRHPGWEHLGTRVVSFGGDHDAISGGGEGRFSALMLEVEDGDLELFNFVVTFGNGERISPPTRLLFDAGNRTRVVDLPGRDRAITRIDFFYRSIRATPDGRATIHLYGRR